MKQYIKNFFGHLKTVITHKYWVFYYGCKLGIPVRAFFHDFSKFHPIEFFESVKFYQGGKSSPINAAKSVNGYSKAWQHHKGHNPHHYEHWTDKYDSGTVSIKMPYKYLVEMIADYLGAARAYHGKNFTLTDELNWWKSKLNGGVCINEHTRNFVTYAFCEFVDTGKVYRINTHFLKDCYESDNIFSDNVIENVKDNEISKFEEYRYLVKFFDSVIKYS